MSFIESENVHITDVTVKGHPNVPNNDGMHFCSCKGIFVRGCDIDTADDCIALSAITDWNKPCENAIISDCRLRSFSKALSIGYMHSIVRNVTVTNCIVRDSNRGICIMASGGSGLVENVVISNIIIDTRVRAGNWWGNGEPIFIMTTYHHNYIDKIPRTDVKYSVRNIIFSSIVCHSENAVGLIGTNGNITDITLRDIMVHLKVSDNISLKGRIFDLAPSEQTDTVPDDGKSYILVAREVEKLTVSNVYGYGVNGNKGIVAKIRCPNDF
jgi:parallel beta-helix repeat protein